MSLDDRPRDDDDEPPPGAPPPAHPLVNPLYVVGGLVVALIVGFLSATGLLVPLAAFLGALVAFVAIQVVIFRVFPPRK
jgi:hypothetical protein